MPEEEKQEIEYGQGISEEDYIDQKSQGTRRRPFGPKRHLSEVENRVQRLYKRQLEGLTCRQLVLDHADKEQIGIATAWRDWNRVQELNNEDFKHERESMAGRIFSMRNRLFNAAMKRGQMATAAQVLDSLAKMVGCDEVQQTNLLPDIRIRVERPDALPAPPVNVLPESSDT